LTCSFGTLAPAAARHVHITSPTTPATCGTVSNTANVATTNDGSPTASASILVNCPDVSVVKIADAGAVSAGDQVGITITVSSIGPAIARSVSLSDPLPSGGALSWSESPDTPDCSISAGALVCNFGALAGGATRSVHIVSPTAAANCGSIPNTATVGAANEPP